MMRIYGRGVVNKLCRNGVMINCRSVVTSVKTLTAQIEAFPEFKLAVEEETKGRFDLAIPYYLRVKDVMSSNMGGQYSDYSALVALRIGKAYCSMGKYEEAINSLGDVTQYSDNSLKVLAYQLASTCHILEGSDISSALEAACDGAAVCESLKDSEQDEDHYLLFSKSYTMQGLSCLLLGQLMSAEEHLQLAARWADNPTDKLMSLSNIGSLFCVKANFLPPVYDNSNLFYPTEQENVTSRDLVRKTTLIRDGLDYWREAISEATQVHANHNPARAMCGPVDMEATPLGPGVEAVSIPPSDDKGKALAPHSGDVSDTLAQDSTGSFTTAYVTVLCNMAEAEVKLGNKENAAPYVSSALEAIKINSQHYPENEFVLAPFLGRCLYLSGCDHFRSGDFVVAEGLFKAAIGKFESNIFCNVDTRHAFEFLRTMNTYGSLLLKWDKREREGEKWMERARSQFTRIPKYQTYSHSPHGELTHMSHLSLILPS